MRPAGEYNLRFEWLKHAYAAADGFGDVKSRTNRDRGGYAPHGFLWGAIDEVAGGTAEEVQSQSERRSARVRLRQFPGVAAPDRLRDTRLDEVWEVLNTYRDGDNQELVCEVQTP